MIAELVEQWMLFAREQTQCSSVSGGVRCLGSYRGRKTQSSWLKEKKMTISHLKSCSARWRLA
jgi:hypothetical protein